MNDLLILVGERVREIRKARGLSQEQLAEMAETKYTYISALGRGKRNLTLTNLDEIAKCL
jgi:transcriptional regulator with XRE-family HTH domain